MKIVTCDEVDPLAVYRLTTATFGWGLADGAIRDLIERLAVVERDFKALEEIEENRERRLGSLGGAD